MIEHCVSFFQKENVRKSYQIYVTDALKLIVDNTSHIGTASGVVDYGARLKKRWFDIIEPQPVKEDANNTMTCKEIADEIWDRIGGERK